MENSRINRGGNKNCYKERKNNQKKAKERREERKKRSNGWKKLLGHYIKRGQSRGAKITIGGLL